MIDRRNTENKAKKSLLERFLLILGFLFFMLYFVMGMGMLIFSIFVIIQGVTHFDIMTIAGVIGIAYSVWAIGQFYEKNKLSSYIKGLFAYILGMITFWVSLVLIGTIIDLINK